MDAVEGKLDAVLAGEAVDEAWIGRHIRSLLGIKTSSSTDREEAFAAWRAFLKSIAQRGPAVLVFEDLHWADEAMLDFIEGVTDPPLDSPMLLLGTARSEIYERRPSWARGKANARNLNLAPLTDAESLALLSLLLGSRNPPAELRRLILEEAGGNPLYTEEYVRLLHERGLLVGKGPAMQLLQGTPIPAPSPIRALIAARLDTLQPERKQLLQDASVIGQNFWPGAVAAVGGGEPRLINAGLRALARQEFIRPIRASTMNGEAEFGFWHLIIRDVAYSQIPRTVRIDKHRRAAGWIESQASARASELADVLAYHYTAALDLASGLRRTQEAADLQEPAIRYLMLAGDRAMGLDTRKAEATYRRALASVADDDSRRPSILAKWAAAVQQAGRPADAARALEEAVSGLRAGGDTLGAAHALSTLASAEFMMGGHRAGEHAAEAVALLEAEQPGPDLVAAFGDMAAWAVVTRGDSKTGIEWAERALELADDLGLDRPVRPLGMRGLARYAVGDRRGLDDLREALNLALARGQSRDAALLYNNLAAALAVIEGPASALSVLEKGIAFADRRGLVEDSWFMAAGTLDVRIDLGTWDEALEIGTTLAGKFEASGSMVGLAITRIQLARILVMRGRSDEAIGFAEWAAETAEHSDAVELTIGAVSVAAAARLAAGDRVRALRLLAKMARAEHVQELAGPYSAALPSMVRTALTAGNPRLATRLTKRLKPTYPYQHCALLSGRALLAEASGATRDAIKLFSAAGQCWRELGVLPELAFALLGEGRSLVASDRGKKGVAALGEARHILTDLRCAPQVAEIDHLINAFHPH